ncbi:MAG: universal stress protein [Cyanobacteria bacterium P01_D01_bin.73]
MELRKILVALDYGEAAHQVLDAAITLARGQSETELVLLHCVNYAVLDEVSTFALAEVGPYPRVMGASYDSQVERMQQEQEVAVEVLSEYCDQCDREGVSATSRSVTGDVGSSICQVAADLDVDAIVMGRRGRTGLAEAMLGSASNHVLHRSHRPVFVVQ